MLSNAYAIIKTKVLPVSSDVQAQGRGKAPEPTAPPRVVHQLPGTHRHSLQQVRPPIIGGSGSVFPWRALAPT